jgi:hypothetical protein
LCEADFGEGFQVRRTSHHILPLHEHFPLGIAPEILRKNSGANGPNPLIATSTAAILDDRSAQILLKNSNFRGDHNPEDRWQARWKFL